MTVEVGQAAPDFTLKDQAGNDVSLADYKGKQAVVLVFYPFTFTGVCQGELCEIRDDPSTFESADAAVLAISCDTRHAQAQCSWHLGRMNAVRGLELSPFGLGTAALVLPYGAPDAEREPPDRAAAVRTIEAALAAGVTLIDTAPAYDGAEALVPEPEAKIDVLAVGWREDIVESTHPSKAIALDVVS